MRELWNLDMADAPREPGKPVLVRPRSEAGDDFDPVVAGESLRGGLFCHVILAAGRLTVRPVARAS